MRIESIGGAGVDSKTRQERQREFTIYLVLFILLIIVGAVGYNNQYPSQNYPYYYGAYPDGFSPFWPGAVLPSPTYWGGPPIGQYAPFMGGPVTPIWW